MYERTVADCEQVLGDTHPNTLLARNNLAHAHVDAGRQAEVDDLATRARHAS